MGSKKRKQTQTYTPAGYVEQGARQAIGLGQRIGRQQYQAYGGERVAGLSENEQAGIGLARTTAGASQPYYDQARSLAERGSQQFTDANMQAYMNPYIEAALDPAARQIREQGALRLNELDKNAAAMEAFGGSRAALMRTETQQNIDESIGDLYKRGLSDAYSQAVDIWGQERARDMVASGQLMNLGSAVGQANRADIGALMTTGATDRSIRQAVADFDYQQFTEERDWDIRNLGGLLTALQGTKGAYSTTQTTETEQKGDALGQAMGLAATIFGAIYNPAGTAAKVAQSAFTGEMGIGFGESGLSDYGIGGE